MATAVIAEAMENVQYSMRFIPKTISHTAYTQDLIKYNVCTLYMVNTTLYEYLEESIPNSL
jgi:hypothetical protein